MELQGVSFSYGPPRASLNAINNYLQEKMLEILLLHVPLMLIYMYLFMSYTPWNFRPTFLPKKFFFLQTSSSFPTSQSIRQIIIDHLDVDKHNYSASHFVCRCFKPLKCKALKLCINFRFPGPKLIL